jgi:hypothetical protein
VAPERPTTSRRAPRAPVHGRRPRPTSPAELIDDVIAELAAASGPAAPIVRRPRPARRPAAPRTAAPRPAAPSPEQNPQLVRRWSGALEAGAEPEPPPRIADPAPTAAPPRARRRIALPRVSVHPRVQRGLGIAGIAAGLVALVLLVAMVRPASVPTDPGATRLTVLPRGSASTLTMADAGALADPSVVPDASAVAPIVERSEAVVAGGQHVAATMTGSTAGWLATTGHRLARGRVFTASEVTDGAHLAVLGSSVAERLFPGSDATGQSVTIADRSFTVIGVLAAPAGAASESVALVPITAAQGITGTGGGRTVERILVSAPTADAVYPAYQEVNNLLLQTHHTANPFSTDFTVTAPATSGGHSALLLWGLGILAAVAPLLGVMAILRPRRAA